MGERWEGRIVRRVFGMSRDWIGRIIFQQPETSLTNPALGFSKTWEPILPFLGERAEVRASVGQIDFFAF